MVKKKSERCPLYLFFLFTEIHDSGLYLKVGTSLTDIVRERQEVTSEALGSTYKERRLIGSVYSVPLLDLVKNLD